MVPRRLKHWSLKFPGIVWTKVEFRELKLEHAQNLGDSRRECDRSDFHTCLTHDHCKDTVLNTEVLQQRCIGTEGLAKRIQGYECRRLRAVPFCSGRLAQPAE